MPVPAFHGCRRRPAPAQLVAGQTEQTEALAVQLQRLGQIRVSVDDFVQRERNAVFQGDQVLVKQRAQLFPLRGGSLSRISSSAITVMPYPAHSTWIATARWPATRASARPLRCGPCAGRSLFRRLSHLFPGFPGEFRRRGTRPSSGIYAVSLNFCEFNDVSPPPGNGRNGDLRALTPRWIPTISVVLYGSFAAESKPFLRDVSQPNTPKLSGKDAVRPT